jgi:hypothetical protein
MGHDYIKIVIALLLCFNVSICIEFRKLNEEINDYIQKTPNIFTDPSYNMERMDEYIEETFGREYDMREIGVAYKEDIEEFIEICTKIDEYMAKLTVFLINGMREGHPLRLASRILDEKVLYKTMSICRFHVAIFKELLEKDVISKWHKIGDEQKLAHVNNILKKIEKD